LKEVGQSGQRKLLGAKVLIIGAGGLGCSALQYLVAAGIGTIGIVDGDSVDESNLQRQVLFSTSDIGKKKVEAAKARLKALNPDVSINNFPVNLVPENALEIMQDYNLVIDGTDNFATRYLVNDACVKLNKPFIYGAIHKFEGQVSVFNYKGGPTYRCLFPDPPAESQIPNCSDVGVLGVLPGVTGILQATEAIKIILEIGEPLSGKLKLVNLLNNSEQVIEFSRNEEQAAKAKAINLEESSTDSACSTLATIQPDELISWMKNGTDFHVLDVRETHEMPKMNYSDLTSLSLGQIPTRTTEIPTDKPLVVICQHGIRSQRAIEFLQHHNFPNQLINLEGGMAAFHQHKATI
jgi:adenylyltransferase/sulfurtransferase